MPRKKLDVNPDEPQVEASAPAEVPVNLPIEEPKQKAVKRAAPKKKKVKAVVEAEAPVEQKPVEVEAPAPVEEEVVAKSEAPVEEEPVVVTELPVEEEKTENVSTMTDESKEEESVPEPVEAPAQVARRVRPPSRAVAVQTELTTKTSTKSLVAAVALGATALGLAAALWFMTSRGAPMVKRSEPVVKREVAVTAVAAKLSAKSLSEGAPLIVLPSNDPQKLSAFQLSVDRDEYSIEKLSFSVSNTTAIENLTLINSGTQEVLGSTSGPAQAMNVFILPTPLTVSVDKPVEIELRAKILAGHSGAIVVINLSANEGEFAGKSGNLSVTALPELNVSSAPRIVREARPILANTVIEKLDIKNGAAPVYRMTLGSEAGEVSIKKMTFRVDLKNVGGKPIVLSPAVRNASVRESGATNSLNGSSSLAGFYEKTDGSATCASVEGITSDDKADESCWLRVVFEPALIVKPGSQRTLDVRLNVEGVDMAQEGLGVMLVSDETDVRMISGKFVRSGKTSANGMIEDTVKLPVDNGTNEYELIWSDSGKVDGWTNGVGLISPGLVRQEFTK